ncbi:MAG TPA: hypothetical protein VHF50_03200 [Solirubrobacterales bacterium]|nr:hypothetical protein [Solirubrobacterales bacterium]
MVGEGEGSTEGGGHPSGGGRERNERAREEIREALVAGYAERVHSLPPTKEELERAHLQQDLELKERYGKWLLWLVTGQLIVADIVFALYFIVGVHWDLPEGVIYVWLATTLVELVGVVTVVTRYLFPRRDSAGSE